MRRSGAEQESAMRRYAIALGLLGLLCAATGAYAAGQGDASAQDVAAIEAMRAQDIDLSEPRMLEFAFYFPQRQGARKAMNALANDGFSGELRAEGGEDAFILFARKAIRVDVDTLSALRIRFETLAKEAGGTYDGWGVP
jgi:hypothetical protein